MLLLSPNRLYSEWKLAGTDVIRCSSTCILKSPKFKGIGRNAQNFADSEKQIQIPDKGKIFVQRDQSGADALICAYLFKPGKFRDLFLHGVKPHTYAAMNIFSEIFIKDYPEVKQLLDTSIPDLKNHPKIKEILKFIKDSNDGLYYFLGKKTIHAANYGEEAGTYSKSIMTETEGKVIIPIKDSKIFLIKHHSKFREIKDYHYETEETVRKTRTLYNLFGYPRTFYGPFSPELFRKAYAYIPAATVAAITKLACASIYKYIYESGKDWELLNDCHDSYLCQCPPEEAIECATKMAEYIEAPLVSPRGESFKMKSEATFGYNWASYHPEKNPKGMMEEDTFRKLYNI